MKIIRNQLDSMKNGEFTDQDIENEKKGIISYINTIDDEQDTQIMYFFGQELLKSNETTQIYKESIQQVTREQLINIASKVNINTIYFLRN